jgi:hypothetical protein
VVCPVFVAGEVSGHEGLQDWVHEWTGHAFTRGFGECVFWFCFRRDPEVRGMSAFRARSRWRNGLYYRVLYGRVTGRLIAALLTAISGYAMPPSPGGLADMVGWMPAEAWAG